MLNTAAQRPLEPLACHDLRRQRSSTARLPRDAVDDLASRLLSETESGYRCQLSPEQALTGSLVDAVLKTFKSAGDDRAVIFQHSPGLSCVPARGMRRRLDRTGMLVAEQQSAHHRLPRPRTLVVAIERRIHRVSQ